jgi:hypothetical protein
LPRSAIRSTDDEEEPSVPDLADVNEVLADAAYVTIGFGLLGFQRAQVRRVELTRQLSRVARQVDEAVTPVVSGLDRRVEDLSDRLPDQARDAVRSLRSAARVSEQLLRQVTGIDEAP